MSGSRHPGVAAAMRDVLAGPEFHTLRSLRDRFAAGRLRSMAERSTADDARIAAYHTLAELLRLLDDFRVRLAHGEAVRVTVREQPPERGRMRIEIVIEVQERAA